MTKIQARIQARRYSDRYNTFWYVREVSPGVFQPYAHHSDDARTVSTFYCGKEWNGNEVSIRNRTERMFSILLLAAAQYSACRPKV